VGEVRFRRTRLALCELLARWFGPPRATGGRGSAHRCSRAHWVPSATGGRSVAVRRRTRRTASVNDEEPGGEAGRVRVAVAGTAGGVVARGRRGGPSGASLATLAGATVARPGPDGRYVTMDDRRAGPPLLCGLFALEPGDLVHETGPLNFEVSDLAPSEVLVSRRYLDLLVGVALAGDLLRSPRDEQREMRVLQPFSRRAKAAVDLLDVSGVLGDVVVKEPLARCMRLLDGRRVHRYSEARVITSAKSRRHMRRVSTGSGRNSGPVVV